LIFAAAYTDRREGARNCEFYCALRRNEVNDLTSFRKREEFMKNFAILLSLLVSGLAFADQSGTCTTRCTVVGYEFLSDMLSPSRCNEVSRCEVFEVDSSTGKCVLKRTEERKSWIPCHHIPPA
jgi:hypothetical protein